MFARDAVSDPPEVRARAAVRARDSVSWSGRGGVDGGVHGAGAGARGLGPVVEAVAAGERQVVLISGKGERVRGDAGRGDSRSEAFESGAVVLYGRCDDDTASLISRGPRCSPIWCPRPHDVLAEHVEAAGRSCAARAGSRRPATAGPASSSDAESERYLLFGAVVDLLARVSTLAPIVLVLDDLHWADRPTIQLLRASGGRGAPLRLFVIGNLRESNISIQITHSWKRSRPCTGKSARRAAHVTQPRRRRAARPTRAECRPRLGRRGCFVTRRVVGRDGQAIRSSSAKCSATWPRPGPSPRTSKAGGSRRRTCEPRACPSVWVRGSAGGSHAWARRGTNRSLAGHDNRARIGIKDVLARVAELDEDTLIDLCDQAVVAALLGEADTPGRYTFAHTLIEHTLCRRHCQQASGRAPTGVFAEALEAICGDDPAERIGELAYHWAHATPNPDAGQAIEYTQRAGDRALAPPGARRALRWSREARSISRPQCSPPQQPPPDGPRCSSGCGTTQRQGPR